MSIKLIFLIPEDPCYVPPSASQERARERLLEIAPQAAEISVKATNIIMFFHCGENFERVLCPSCGSAISEDWWKDRMDDDYKGNEGFELARYPAPCCGAAHTLHELIYEWPQGFGRFALTATNAKIGLLGDEHKQEFEEILGRPLRIIYCHM